MHPLTVTWALHIYTSWGWENHQAWVHAGFDNILFTPNGLVHRLITRLATENLFHPFQPFILGQKNLAPKIADLYDIPLIFYGENEAEYGNPKMSMDSCQMDWDYFSFSNEDEVFLGGSSLSQLRELGLEPIDWEPYMPANPESIIKKTLRFITLVIMRNGIHKVHIIIRLKMEDFKVLEKEIMERLVNTLLLMIR